MGGSERPVEAALERLAAIPGLMLVASIRSGNPPARPSWGTRLEVHRLISPHDRDLLLDIAGDVAPDDPLLADALAALDGWPLAIELFAAEAGGAGSLAPAWRRLGAERAALLGRGDADPDRLSSVDVSLGFSLRSPSMRLSPPHAPDAPVRLYAMLGHLPDGLLLTDADRLLPGNGDAAARSLIRTRLARLDRDRLRMLAPVREHAASTDLAAADRQALQGHYLGLATELRRYFNGDHRGIDLPRLRAELVNIDALIARAVDPTATTATAAAFQCDLGNLSLSIGDARRELGQLALAFTAYERARGIYSYLTSCDPGNPQWQRDLSVSSERRGDVRRDQGDLPGALQAYTESKNIRDKLATADPANALWQRDLSISWNKLGDVRRDQGDLPGALRAYTEQKNISDKLAAADPGNTEWQRDLSISWDRLGEVRQAQGDLPAALLAFFTGAKNIRDRLPAADPDNAQWQRDLSISWDRLGDVHRDQGDLPGALQAFTEGKNIARQARRRRPRQRRVAAQPLRQLE